MDRGVQWELAATDWDGLADGVIHVETVPAGGGAGTRWDDSRALYRQPRVDQRDAGSHPDASRVPPRHRPHRRRRPRRVHRPGPYRFSANLAVEGGATVVAAATPTECGCRWR